MSAPESLPAPERRQYPNPPIAEAIIDIRTTLPENVTLDHVLQVNTDTVDQYPHRRDSIAVTGEITVGPNVSSSTTQSRNGYVFLTADERSVYQARLDGFTFSRLAPYENWESFRDSAREIWASYRTALSPASIDRVALRYVNRINLPIPFEDFEQYLHAVPALPMDLPQSWMGYLMQVQIPYVQNGLLLHLTSAILPQEHEDSLPMLLDIDLFRPSELPFGQFDLPADDERLWDLLDEMHTVKNDIFEACITDRARELFD